MMGEYAAKQIFRLAGRQTSEGGIDVAVRGAVREKSQKNVKETVEETANLMKETVEETANLRNGRKPMRA